MTDNTQPRPSKGSMEEAEKWLEDTTQLHDLVRHVDDAWENLVILLARRFDKAKAEGAERVVRAMKELDEARGMSITNGMSAESAARQALQEEKGEGSV